VLNPGVRFQAEILAASAGKPFLSFVTVINMECARATVTVGGSTLDAEGLFGAAAAVAARVHGGPVAAVHATTSLHTVVAILGCLLAGVPAVPVPPDAGPRERDHVLRDSGAGIWLGGAVDGIKVDTIPVDLKARSQATFAGPPAESTALILYTSGTTGASKGVLVSRRAVRAGLDGVADAWAWTPGDVLVHGLPLFHVHGLVLGVLGPIHVGSALIHTERPRPERYAAAAEQCGGSMFFGVPTVWSRVAGSPASARALSRARLLVSGSAPLPAGVARDIAALTGQVPVERYGMTETLITLAARADQPRQPGWVGTPIAGVRSRLVNDHGVPVPAGEDVPGDLQVRGDTLFDGYLNRPEASAECWTHDGWFRTGDVAALRADGWYRIVGRKSIDLIKTGGYRVGAAEIEASLLDHPAVAETAVIGVADPDLGQRIVAYVVGTGASAGELIDHVARTLSAHKRPREIRFVDHLPHNDVGKVQKALLMEDPPAAV
jgi:fatty acid CoA ligase FadD36